MSKQGTKLALEKEPSGPKQTLWVNRYVKDHDAEGIDGVFRKAGHVWNSPPFSSREMAEEIARRGEGLLTEGWTWIGSFPYDDVS